MQVLYAQEMAQEKELGHLYAQEMAHGGGARPGALTFWQPSWMETGEDRLTGSTSLPDQCSVDETFTT